MKIFNLSAGLLGVCALAAGCSSIYQAEAVYNAIGEGYVSGLSKTNHFDSIVWSFPSAPPIKQYSKISSLTAYVSGGTTNSHSHAYVFLLGKSSTNSEWEVFGCTTWTNHHWEYVPVTLPHVSSK